MRNIYDIIAEQKALIDVNIASYDLEYTNKYFIKNQDTYYLNESFGESIKKIIDAFVKFVKKLIRSIKELIQRVFGFFRKRESSVESLEAKIADANKKYDEVVNKNKINREEHNKKIRDKMEKDRKDAEDQAKALNEKRKKEDEARRKEQEEFLFRNTRKDDEEPKEHTTFELGTKINDLPSIIGQYAQEIEVSYAGGPLSHRVDFLKDLMKGFSNTIDTKPKYLEGLNSRYFVEIFNDLLFDDPNIKNYTPEVQSIIYDEENTKVMVSRCKRTIVEYIYNHEEFLNVVKTSEKHVESVMDKELRNLKILENTPLENLNEEQKERLISTMSSAYQSISFKMSSILNFLCVSTVKAYNEYIRLAQIATDDYVRSLAAASKQFYPDRLE